MPQAAYDQSKPNGTSRRQVGDRTILIFRLYQRTRPFDLGEITAGKSVLSSILDPVRGAVRTARNFLRTSEYSPLALHGRLLVKEFRFVSILKRMTDTPELRTHFSYTRDGFFLDTPVAKATGVTHFRIAGQTHWSPVLVNGVKVDGDAAIKDFQDLIDDYFFPPDGKVTPDFELYMMDLRAPISAEDPFGRFEWLIHPLRHGPRTSQSASRPFMRDFEFDFVGLQNNRDIAKAEDNFLKSLLSTGFLGDLLHNLHLDQVILAVQDVFETIDEFKGFFDDVGNLVLTVTDYVTGATNVIRAGIGKVRGLLTSVQTIIGRVEDGIDLVKQLPGLIGDDLRRLEQNFPRLRGSESEVPGVICIDELRRVEDFLLALTAQPQSFSPTLSDQPAAPDTVAVAISPGMTIERLAQQFGTDIESLIAVNNLRYPFIDSRLNPSQQRALAERRRDKAEAIIRAAHEEHDAGYVDAAQLRAIVVPAGAEKAAANIDLERWVDEEVATPPLDGVIYAGDVLRVPRERTSVLPSLAQISPAVAQSIEAATGSAVTEEDRLFGVDLLLNSNGDLELDFERGDIRLERGLQHMINVQVRYVKLPLGELRYVPGIGNFAYENLAKWQGPGTNQLLAFAMWQTLRQDPRVKTIRNVRAETRAGVARLFHDIELINGSSVSQLTVPVS